MNTNLLRQKILDLAIRGKLVPQDPNDEPASVLLERICAEKERLIAEGKIKRPQKAKASSVESHYRNFEPPFPIPDSWEWVKLEDIAYVASGSTPSKESFTDFGIPYLKMYNLRNQKIDFGYHPQYISEAVHNGKLARSRAQSGDLLMNIVGPPLGKLAIVPESIQQCNFNQAAVMIRPYSNVAILNQYLFFYLSEMGEINSIATKGTAGQTNISLTQSQNMRIAVPPLEEIVRINDKITILMSLIEDIENGTYELQHSIISIKYKILELAMHGKLVQQDPMDEPAASMLRRINPKAKIITDNPHSWNIPHNWCWTRVQDVFHPMERTLPSGDEFLYIDIASIDNKTNTASPKQVKTKYAPSRASRKTQRGDIVFSMVRPYLRNIAVVPIDGCIASTGFYILSGSSAIYPPFAFKLSLSDYFVCGLNSYMKGDNSPSINKINVEDFIIPLPPFNEQKRINTKIDELYSLIDSIKVSLQS